MMSATVGPMGCLLHSTFAGAPQETASDVPGVGNNAQYRNLGGSGSIGL
jgi:hypothetical protein